MGEETVPTTRVISPDGREVSVSLGQLKQAIDEGYTEAKFDPAGAVAREEQSRLASPAVGLATFVAHTGGMATGGLSDLAAIQGADDPREAARIVRGMNEAHPVASLAGDLAGVAVPSPIGKLGGLASRGAGRLAGTAATTTLGRAGQAAARLAAQGAVENAFYRGGQEVSEEVLGDPEATGGRLFAAFGRGAFTGGLEGLGAGAALGAGGSLLASGAKAAGGAVSSRLAKAVEKAGLAEREAANTAALRKTATEDLAAMRSSFDKTKARFATSEFAAAAEQHINETLGSVKTPDDQAAAKQMRTLVAKTAESLGPAPSFDEVGKVRAFLDAGRAKAGRTSVTAEGYRAIRGILDDQYEAAATRAAEEIGGLVPSKYASAKALAADISKVEKAVAESSVAVPANPSPFSLTGALQGAGGALAGGAIASLTGHLGAAALGGIASHVGLGFLNRAVRQYGGELAAMSFDKASRLSQLGQIAHRTTAKVEQGVQAAVHGTGAQKFPRMTRDQAVALIPKIQEAASNSATVQAFARRASEGIEHAAPKTAVATAMIASRALDYLARTAPKGGSSGPSLQPLLATQHYQPSEVDAWVDRVVGVETPEAVLHAVHDGTLTPEMVDAVREIYGKSVFVDVQRLARFEVAKRKEPLTWQQQKSLAVLLGVPTDATLTGDFIQRMQADIAKSQEQQKSQGQAPGAKRPVKRISDAEMTPAERIAL